MLEQIKQIFASRWQISFLTKIMSTQHIHQSISSEHQMHEWHTDEHNGMLFFSFFVWWENIEWLSLKKIPLRLLLSISMEFDFEIWDIGIKFHPCLDGWRRIEGKECVCGNKPRIFYVWLECQRQKTRIFKSWILCIIGFLHFWISLGRDGINSRIAEAMLRLGIRIKYHQWVLPSHRRTRRWVKSLRRWSCIYNCTIGSVNKEKEAIIITTCHFVFAM